MRSRQSFESIQLTTLSSVTGGQASAMSGGEALCRFGGVAVGAAMGYRGDNLSKAALIAKGGYDTGVNVQEGNGVAAAIDTAAAAVTAVAPKSRVGRIAGTLAGAWAMRDIGGNRGAAFCGYPVE